MSVKAAKAKRKNGKAASKLKRAQNALEAQARPHPLPKSVLAAEKMTLDEILTQIENDPDAPLIAKELAALRRERDKSGEPYLTIEQIQAELGRDDGRYDWAKSEARTAGDA